ncbi:MAG: alpha/beta fold hydrolase [Caldilineaceae bacterium]
MPYVTIDAAAVDSAHTVAQLPSIYYEVHDQRSGLSGPTVLLIHGVGGDHLHWPPQLRRLHNVIVYAIDLPGHGRSAPLLMAGHAELTIATYSTVIQAFILQLALAQVVLVGHSMGGAIVLDHAQRYGTAAPYLVAGLVLVGTGAQLPVNEQILNGLQEDFPAMTAKLVEWMYGPAWPPTLRQRAVEELRKNSVTQLLTDFRACNRFDGRADLATLTMPSLVICGELDKMTPVASSRLLTDALPMSTLHLVPACGHMVMLEAPKSVTALIQAFIDTCSAKSG